LGGYLAINRLLGLRERRKSERQTPEAFLKIVHVELLNDAAHRTRFSEELPAMQVPYPGFQVEGWPLVSQAQFLLAVNGDTVLKLLHAYNRMQSANAQCEELRDILSGPSALNIHLVAAEALLPDDRYPAGIATVIAEFEAHQSSLRDVLLKRIEDLKLALDDAIDAVESELAIASPVKAAGRLFRHTGTPYRLPPPPATYARPRQLKNVPWPRRAGA